MKIKSRPKSAIRVPEGIPKAKQSLWRRVWRAAFLVSENESLSRKIANGVVSPDAIKDKSVNVPKRIPESKRKTWVKVYHASNDVIQDDRQAQKIAYGAIGVDHREHNLMGSETSFERLENVNLSEGNNTSNSGVLVHRKGGLIKPSDSPAKAIKSFASDIPEQHQAWVEGYLVSWGSTRDTDLQGEFFSARTDFCLDWFQERPVLYHHGMDQTTGLKKIGSFVTIKTDDIGLWVQAQLDLRDRYAQAVYDMVKSKQFGWSSGSVDHLVKIAENGEILTWPLIEGSITPTPAQPAKTAVRPIKGAIPIEGNTPITLQAFKAIVGTDTAFASEYLRGLDRHLAAEARVGKRLNATTSNDSQFTGVKSNMARYKSDSAWYISRAVAKAFGIKDVTQEELKAVADEVKGVVDDEITAAAVDALEAEAVNASEDSEALSSYRGYRNDEAYLTDDEAMNMDYESVSSDFGYAMDDEMGPTRSRRRGYRGYRGDSEIESIMANEIATQMEEEQMESQAARALRRRAWKRAMRQIAQAEGPDGDVVLGYGASEMAVPNLAETAPGVRYRRRRGYRGYRGDEPIMMDDEIAGMGYMADDEIAGMGYMADDEIAGMGYMADDEIAGMGYMADDELASMSYRSRDFEAMSSVDDDVVTDVAAASYRRGFRSGLRSAYRQVENGEAVNADDELGIRSEHERIAAQTNDEDSVESAVRAYRAGYRRGLKRAIRQIEEETKTDELASKGRFYRTAGSGLKQPLQEVVQPTAPPTEYTDAPSGYVPVPQANTPQNHVRSRLRRGYRGYGYRNRDMEAGMGGSYMADEDMEARMGGSYMAEDEMAGMGRGYMAEDEMAGMGGYRSRMEAVQAEQEAAVMEGEALKMHGEAQRMREAAQAMRMGVVDSVASDPELEAMQMEEEAAAMTDEAYQMEEEANAIRMGYATDEFSAQSLDEGVRMGYGKSYRRRGPAYRSIGSTANNADYWRRRYNELARLEAPGQRAFKSLGIQDVADRPGAYENAFKSYLIKGLGLMNDTEKYVLQGKGKARWDATTFAYDSSTKSVKAYSSSSDASVGFLVPEDWVNELNTNVMTQTVMAPECRTRTTTSDRIVQPNLITTDARRAHAAQVRWPGESPESNLEHRTPQDQYNQITIPIHVMLISLASTNSALEDSTFNLEEEINEAFAEAVAVSYDQLIWGGDGQGKLQGIIVNEQVTGTQSTGVQSVGGFLPSGSNDGIVTADVLKQMLFHLPQGYRQRAKWYMNSNTGLEIATLKDGEGNYLIDQRDESLRSVGMPDRLLGKPIVYNDWATDIAEDSFPLVLADLTRGYVIGRRVEFSIRRFDDSNYAEHDQVLFLGRARLGGQVLQPAAFKTLKIAPSA